MKDAQKDPAVQPHPGNAAGYAAGNAAEHAGEPALALRIRGLSRHYASEGERVDVLKGVDLDVPKGTILSVEGASGAGKSTLLHLVGAIDRPSAGSICVFGREITELSLDAIERFRAETVGFIFQHHYLLPDFTLIENVMLPLWILRRNMVEMREKAADMLALVGLGHRLHHYPSQISGGEMARAGVARALVGEKPMILADEPTGNLDRGNSEKLADLLWDLQGRMGFNLMLVTHDMELAARVPHRYRLVNGGLERFH